MAESLSVSGEIYEQKTRTRSNFGYVKVDEKVTGFLAISGYSPTERHVLVLAEELGYCKLFSLESDGHSEERFQTREALAEAKPLMVGSEAIRNTYIRLSGPRCLSSIQLNPGAVKYNTIDRRVPEITAALNKSDAKYVGVGAPDYFGYRMYQEELAETLDKLAADIGRLIRLPLATKLDSNIHTAATHASNFVATQPFS